MLDIVVALFELLAQPLVGRLQLRQAAERLLALVAAAAVKGVHLLQRRAQRLVGLFKLLQLLQQFLLAPIFERWFWEGVEGGGER